MLRPFQLTAELFHHLVGKFQRIVFLADFIVIRKDLRNAAAVLLFQPVDGIQAGFNRIQLAGVKVRVLQCIPRGAAQLLQHIVSVVQFIAVLGKIRQVLRRGIQFGRNLLQRFQHAAQLLAITIEQGVDGSQRFGDALGVFDALLLLGQLLFFPVGQPGVANLLKLKLEDIHPLQLIAFIHLQLFQSVGTGHPLCIGFGIVLQFFPVRPKAVQKAQMLFSAQQLLVIMLAVNIDQQRANLPQHGSRCGPSIQAALTLAGQVDLTLYQQLTVLQRISQLADLFRQRCGNPGKQRRNTRAAFPCPNDLLKGAATQNRVDSADQDGLAGAGFPGKNVEAFLEIDSRLPNHGDIFNIKLRKHTVFTAFLSHGLP